MMGSESLLSLSEITVTPPPETPGKITNTTTSEPDVDELIEKWRNLDVGILSEETKHITSQRITFGFLIFLFFTERTAMPS